MFFSFNLAFEAKLELAMLWVFLASDTIYDCRCVLFLLGLYTSTGCTDLVIFCFVFRLTEWTGLHFPFPSLSSETRITQWIPNLLFWLFTVAALVFGVFVFFWLINFLNYFKSGRLLSFGFKCQYPVLKTNPR